MLQTPRSTLTSHLSLQQLTHMQFVQRIRWQKAGTMDIRPQHLMKKALDRFMT